MFKREQPFFDLCHGFFEESSDEEIQEKIQNFVQGARPTETKRKIEFWGRKLREHIHSIGQKKDMLAMNKKELNEAICSFAIDAKKADGSCYETTTIHSFFGTINRYMKDNNLGNLETDSEFQSARDVKRAKLKILKAEGKGNKPNRTTAISRQEEEKLYETGHWTTRVFNTNVSADDSLDANHAVLWS